MQDPHQSGGRPRWARWISYAQLMTPRQLRWLLAGYLGMVLLVAAIPGGYWLVGSFSDTVDVELSGHGVVWIQFQAGLDYEPIAT